MFRGLKIKSDMLKTHVADGLGSDGSEINESGDLENGC